MRMMNKLNKWTFLFALVIFAGCSNGTQNKKAEEPTSEKTYTLQGTVNLSGEGRSATTSFAKLDNLTYKVTAYNAESETYTQANPAVAELVEEEGNIHYSFKIKEAGTWVITASANYAVNDSTSVEVMSATKNWTVAENAATNAEIGVGDIVLNVKGYYVDTKGSIDLTIYDQTNKVVKVTMNAKALISTSQNSARVLTKTINFSGTYEAGKSERTAVIQLEDIIPNCYEISFDFFNDKGKIIYSCKEAVSVFGGYKTDTWVGTTNSDSAYLFYDSSLEATRFVITDELLGVYNQAGDFSNPIVLWSNIGTEYIPDQYGQNKDGASGVLTSEYDTYQTGTQIFAKTSNNMTIFNPSCLTSSSAFCFDDQVPTSVYVLDTDDKTLYKFSPSYAAYKQSSFNEDYDEVDLSGIIAPTLENGMVLSSIYPSIAYYGGYIFFFYLTRNESWTQFSDYLGVIDVANPDNFLYCPTNDSSGITSMAIDSVEINGEDKLILCYSYFSNSNSCDMILSKAIALETNSLSFDDSVDRMETLSNANLGLNFLDNEIYASVTDMLIWENTLYIALAAYSSVKTKHPNKYIYDDGYINKAILVSNGGIAKIDLTNPDSYSLGEWTSGSKVLGWFTDGVFDDNSGTSLANLVSMSPSPDNDYEYFYGARKFIARKPDELVIADDGGYVDIDTDADGNITAINDAACKNRIVTVDLKDESITAADVDVSFDVTFQDWKYEPADTYTGYGFTNF